MLRDVIWISRSGIALAVLGVLWLGCAETPPEQTVPAPVAPVVATTPAPKAPPYHSSLAAVLGHRDQLKLSEDQVRALGEIDSQLQTRNAAVRAANEKHGQTGQPANAVGASSPAGSSPGGTGYPGGGRMGGGRGMGRGGGFRHGPAVEHKKPADPQTQMDDNDTDAFFSAESILTEEQQAAAREIAEEYREKLYEWREAVRTHKPEEKK